MHILVRNYLTGTKSWLPSRVRSFFHPYPWGKFSTNLSPSGRIRQVQKTTNCHNSGTMNLNSIRICTVRVHAPYKCPPRNTMPRSSSTNSNPLRISWSDTSFSPTAAFTWMANDTFLCKTCLECIVVLTTHQCKMAYVNSMYKMMRESRM